MASGTGTLFPSVYDEDKATLFKRVAEKWPHIDKVASWKVYLLYNRKLAKHYSLMFESETGAFYLDLQKDSVLFPKQLTMGFKQIDATSCTYKNLEKTSLGAIRKTGYEILDIGKVILFLNDKILIYIFNVL